ncbi:hypothetical protein QWT87_02765 [Chryseobacterium sp. APV1]|uniref:Uncharacterized protein n=1 Tax=Chryseobacterium urinae TaxID=3058400 RepID=A0ABT8TYD2_9FLAO|nr:hypothetical protein [Chryseobacterium sp. APV1]MDO3423795.1 hypothetical protein [Chryseobacterium sp. APV1]
MQYFVYVLDHIYTDETYTDFKRLGYFNDLKELEEAKNRAVQLSGFKMFPESFVIKKYIVNKVNWKEGFTEVIGEIGRDYLESGDEVDVTIVSVKEMELESVFYLSHIYTIHTHLDDERCIGLFSSYENAHNVMNELKDKSGFKDFPDNFILEEVILNAMHWTTGFYWED